MSGLEWTVVLVVWAVLIAIIVQSIVNHRASEAKAAREHEVLMAGMPKGQSTGPPLGRVGEGEMFAGLPEKDQPK